MNQFDLFSQPINLIFSQNKICSKRSVKIFLKNNDVIINNARVTSHKILIDTDLEDIFINGKKLDVKKHLYIVMNKPMGYVCSTVSDSHKTVFDLLKKSFLLEEIQKIKCVGRLDCDTTGLLIFSTNGTFVNKLTSPENKVKKIYYVKIKNNVGNSEKQLYEQKASTGIFLPPEKKYGAYTTFPFELNWISQNECFITLKEGRFHEVKRIFLALNNFVEKLTRVQIGDYRLPNDLEEGNFIFGDRKIFEKK